MLALQRSRKKTEGVREEKWSLARKTVLQSELKGAKDFSAMRILEKFSPLLSERDSQGHLGSQRGQITFIVTFFSVGALGSVWLCSKL